MQLTPSTTSNPPFLLTYWNPFNKKSPELVQSFLNYVKDVSIANYTANVTGNLVGSHIENTSREQISILKDCWAFLDQRLTGIRQEQINTNILLQNIGLLLKLPDSEKQRQLYIERGLKFSTQSLKDEDIAIDAKNEFDDALKLMPQDWFVLQQLGILLLYNEKVLDISQAKEYFLKAAKYANADSETKEITFINGLYNQQLSFPFENKDNTQDGLKVFVREAYLNAALAAYILADFEEAANISKKGLAIDPEDTKSLFFAAKYLARYNKKEEAFVYLKKAIINSPYLCIATSADEDLKTIPEALDFCKKCSDDFYSKIEVIKRRIDELKDFINNLIVFELKDKIDKKNYLVKSFELLQLSLIDNNVDYHGKDSLYNAVIQDYHCISLASKVASYTDFEYLMINGEFPLADNPVRQKKIFDQIKSAGYIIKETYKGETRFQYDWGFFSERESIIESLDIKLDGYFVKDLYYKWDEISGIFERKRLKEKEKELQLLEVEKEKLLQIKNKEDQYKKSEELFKYISDLHENKKYIKALKEIKSLKGVYPENEYLISLEKKVSKVLRSRNSTVGVFIIIIFISCWFIFPAGKPYLMLVIFLGGLLMFLRSSIRDSKYNA